MHSPFPRSKSEIPVPNSRSWQPTNSQPRTDRTDPGPHYIWDGIGLDCELPHIKQNYKKCVFAGVTGALDYQIKIENALRSPPVDIGYVRTYDGKKWEEYLKNKNPERKYNAWQLLLEARHGDGVVCWNGKRHQLSFASAVPGVEKREGEDPHYEQRKADLIIQHTYDMAIPVLGVLKVIKPYYPETGEWAYVADPDLPREEDTHAVVILGHYVAVANHYSSSQYGVQPGMYFIYQDSQPGCSDSLLGNGKNLVETHLVIEAYVGASQIPPDMHGIQNRRYPEK